MIALIRKCYNAYRSWTWNKVIRRSIELMRRQKMMVPITRFHVMETRSCTTRLVWCSRGPRWRKVHNIYLLARLATVFQTSKFPLSNRWKPQLSHQTCKLSGRVRTTSTQYSKIVRFLCFLTIRLLRLRNSWRLLGPVNWKIMIEMRWPNRVISNLRRPWSVVPKPLDSLPRNRRVSKTHRGWVQISKGLKPRKWSTIVITKAQNQIQTMQRKW